MKKIDLAFSPEGDLLLGAPKVNNEGQILYRLENGTTTIDKNVGGKPMYDLAYVRDKDAFRQNVINRLKTDNPDWYHHPAIGGNLSDLIGEPNTRETSDRGSQLIMESLTYDGLISPAQLKIRPVPVSENEILFMLTINIGEDETYRLPIVFDLERGLKEV